MPRLVLPAALALCLGGLGCAADIVVTPEAPPVDLMTHAPAAPAAPLVLVDDVPIPFERVRALDRDRIARIEVVKGRAAARLYGERARGGVILISLKP